MKNLIASLIGAALLVAGGLMIVSNLQKEIDELSFKQGLDAARVDFVRQAALVNLSPDDRLASDRAQLMKKHLDTIEGLYKAHPAQKRDDAFILALEDKAKKGERDKAKTAEYRTRYDYVKDMWKVLREGSYKPLYSGFMNGVRFDIVSMKKVTDGGEPSIRMDVFFWGAIKEQLGFGQLEVTSVIDLDDDAGGKKKGKVKKGLIKVNGSDLPTVLQDRPWDWIPEWPPGVMVGYYVGLPLFHPKAAAFTMKLEFQARTQGGTSMPVTLEWKDVPVDPSMRALPGSKWDAEVAEASDEDLQEAGIPVEK